MAAHTESRRDASDRRQAILDAALELFAERGFHGTAVPLVAERAGVGAGTLYRYFESKEALVNALYRSWKAALASSLFEGFPTDLPPRALFGECYRRLCRFAVEHPRAFTFLELHHHAPYLDAQSRACDELVLRPIRDLAEQARHALALKDLAPELLMAVVYGAVVGLVRAAEAGHLPMPLEEALRQAEPVVWEAIRR
ncbi:MAG: TetR/AcrR family transcriptional regulator [Deltaproteobacteria bacterium]|nr:TetR/AcrR family transcriptional regulator [Deltaproteobacteria bacterium]